MYNLVADVLKYRMQNEIDDIIRKFGICIEEFSIEITPEYKIEIVLKSDLKD